MGQPSITKSNFFVRLWIGIVVLSVSFRIVEMSKTKSRSLTKANVRAAQKTSSRLSNELDNLTASTESYYNNDFFTNYDLAREQCVDPTQPPPECKPSVVEECERGFFFGQILAKRTLKAMDYYFDLRTFKCIMNKFEVKEDIWYQCVIDGFRKQYLSWQKCYAEEDHCAERMKLLTVQKKYLIYLKIWQQNWYEYLKRSCDQEKIAFYKNMAQQVSLGEWKCSLQEIYGISDVEEVNCDINIEVPEIEEVVDCDAVAQETEASQELDLINTEHEIIKNEHKNISGVIPLLKFLNLLGKYVCFV